MKRNPYYQLQYIANIPYLVTFGQGHADFLHDLRLNDTGAFLWEQLENTEDLEQLVALCAKHYHCDEQQCSVLRTDIKQFVDALYTHGILLQEDYACPKCSSYTTLQIAGLYCNIHASEDLLTPELLDFATTIQESESAPFQNIHILQTPPALTENGSLLLRNDALSVIQTEREFILLFPASGKIKEAHLSKDGEQCSIYCTSDISEADTADISYVIRILFFYFALQNKIIALHSASILYGDKLWLFSAPSGTGKSTHADLWKRILHTPIINGDINLIGNTPDGPVVYGTPWCGTSEIYDSKAYPLGGVFLLKQGTTSSTSNLSDDEKQLFLLHRSLSPSWTADLFNDTLAVIHSICPSILIKRLTCTMNTDAVYCTKKEIDNYLAEELHFC